MRSTRVLLAFLLIVAFDTTVASAQNTRAVGVAMGYPTTIGVLWHVSDRFAIKPEIGLSWNSIESEPSGPFSLGEFSTDTRQSSFGVAGLFYLGRWDALRTYVSPRIVYITSTSESRLSVSPPPVLFEPVIGTSLFLGDTETETSTSGLSVTGSFGGQYWLGERFSIFGEFGLAYSQSETSGEVSIAERKLTSKTVGTRTAAGVVLYF
jgi:hypothetical protein